MTAFTWRYPLREIRRRPVRSALTVVGIVLGVAAATAVALGTHGSRMGYPGLFATLAGRAQLEVRGIAQTPFVPDLDRAAAIPGVEAVAPLVQMPVSLLVGESPEPILLLGSDARRDESIRNFTVREGMSFRWMGKPPRGVWLTASFARRNRLRLNDIVTLLGENGARKIPIAGLLGDEGPARFNRGAIALMPLEEAQESFGLTGKVHSISVVVSPNASVAAIRSRLAEAFPLLEVGAPAERGESASVFLATIEQPLGSLGAVAVVAGALVILNTFLMHLGERRRQLALLRALGATRAQVIGVLVRQALLLGGLGTLLGVPLGVFLAWVLLRLYESILAIPLPQLALSWSVLILAAALGPLMTLAATLIPARRAAAREPLPDLRARQPASDGPHRGLTAIGVALVVAVLLFVLAIVRGWLPGSVGMRMLPLVVTAAMIGCACLVPLVQTPLLTLIGTLTAPVLGVEGRLAVRQLIRHRARTGLTLGVLFAAMTAAISFGASLFNNARDIRVWFDHTIDAPFFVRAVPPDPALVIRTASLPGGAVARFAELAEVSDASRIRFVTLRADRLTLLIVARDFPAGPPPLLISAGDAGTLVERLRAGEIALGTALAQRLHAGVGDTITLPTPRGPRAVRVAALVKEYSIAGLAAYMDYQAARGLFDFDSPHALAVHARPGQDVALAEALDREAAREGVWVQRQEEFRATIEKTIGGVHWLIAGMLGLIIGVAAAGIVNTLTTNILDQTRELGVLRALGMKRGGVVKLVLAQALVLALVACLTGGPAGVLVAWLMNVSTPGLLGHHVPFHLHPVYVGACLAGVVGLSLLAALLPARRAAHLAVIDAVRYE